MVHHSLDPMKQGSNYHGFKAQVSWTSGGSAKSVFSCSGTTAFYGILFSAENETEREEAKHFFAVK